MMYIGKVMFDTFTKDFTPNLFFVFYFLVRI